MDLEGIMLSELCQMEKDKYCIDLIPMWNIQQTNKTPQINKQTKPKKSKHVDVESRFVFTREEGTGGINFMVKEGN